MKPLPMRPIRSFPTTSPLLISSLQMSWPRTESSRAASPRSGPPGGTAQGTMTRTGLSVRLPHQGVKGPGVSRMGKDWIIGAQLSTTHSSPDRLGVDHVLSIIERVRSVLDLDILIVGDREIPEIFRLVTGHRGRPAKQIFLWYNVLSDNPAMEDSDLVVNWRGQRSRGWGGWAEKRAEVAETFRFACPNNPAT